LQSNQISTLPKSLYDLSELKLLALTDNKLTSISPGIKKMTALKEVHFSINQINTLPKSILEMYSLETFRAFSNHLSDEEVEWWEQNANFKISLRPQKRE
jgi:leucine-rich repeat protein SHOC2